MATQELCQVLNIIYYMAYICSLCTGQNILFGGHSRTVVASAVTRSYIDGVGQYAPNWVQGGRPPEAESSLKT